MLIAAATDSDPPISALRVILELNIRPPLRTVRLVCAQEPAL
jgi:hypothetical protein